jgi:hypothetical protein
MEALFSGQNVTDFYVARKSVFVPADLDAKKTKKGKES